MEQLTAADILEEAATNQHRYKAEPSFLQDRDRASIMQIRHGLCHGGGAQRGPNPETHAAVAQEWEKRRASQLTLLETFRFLKSCHRRAPFLFFDGNTFAEVGSRPG